MDIHVNEPLENWFKTYNRFFKYEYLIIETLYELENVNRNLINAFWEYENRFEFQISKSG